MEIQARKRGAGLLLLSLPETAGELGISLGMVKLLIRRGDLASVRIGRRRLVDRRDLLRFVARNKRQAG